MEPQTPPQEQTPTPPPAPASPAPEAPAQPESAIYPVTINIPMPDKQSRVLALFSIPFFLIRFVLLIPHFIVLYFVQAVALVVAWLNIWVILFTGHGSPGLHNFAAGSLRWSTRLSAYLYNLTDKYPPFSLYE